MTRKEYEAYEERFQSFMQDSGLNCLTTDDEHPEFTWRKCEVCGGPAGMRYLARGYMPELNIVIGGIEICPDCLYYATYGQLDDMTMLDMTD